MNARSWSWQLMVLLAVLCPALQTRASEAPQWLPITAQWCLADDHCIGLEVAATARQQAIGLQRRPPLPPLRGMWFPFPERTQARFWMHHTPSALDMVFVSHGRVVAIEAETQPCPRLPCRSYGPPEAVDGVIELAAGQAAIQGIAIGTVVQLEPLEARPSGAQATP